MKKVLKITSILLIAAIALFSCNPGFDLIDSSYWNEIAKEYDPQSGYHTTSGYLPIVTASNLTVNPGTNHVNKITMQFPASADLWEKDSPEGLMEELNKFVSFWSYNKDAILGYTEHSTLTPVPLTLKFEERGTDTVTFSFDKTFAATDSDLIIKIDGSKYTFQNGVKLDMDGFGKTGEAVYDDAYITVSVSGITAPDAKATGFVEPGNVGWYAGISTSYTVLKDDLTANTENPNPDGTLDSYTLKNIVIATAYVSYNPNPDDTSEQAEAALAALWDEVFTAEIARQYKIEEYDPATDRWTVVAGTEGTIIKNDSPPTGSTRRRAIVAPSLTIQSGKAYRVVFDRAKESFTTDKEYFGVKQRLWFDSSRRYINRKIASNPLVYFKVDANGISSYECADIEFDTIPYSYDANGRNFIIDVEIINGIAGTGTNAGKTYWLKEMSLAEFKNNFEILAGTTDTHTSSAIYTKLDIINEVKYMRVGIDDDATMTADNIGFNVIRITLDPNFVMPQTQPPYYFYRVSDGLLNECPNGAKFRTQNIWENGGKLYPIPAGLSIGPRPKIVNIDHWSGSFTEGTFSYVYYEVGTSNIDDGYYPVSYSGLPSGVSEGYSINILNDYGSIYFYGTPTEYGNFTVSISFGGASTSFNLYVAPGGGGTTVPDAVSDLSANAGDGIVSLTWSAPYNGGATITSYSIYVNGSPYGSTSSTNYTVSSLTNGTLYLFTVYAINSEGSSLVSNTATATPTSSTPPFTPPLTSTTLPIDGTITTGTIATAGGECWFELVITTTADYTFVFDHANSDIDDMDFEFWYWDGTDGTYLNTINLYSTNEDLTEEFIAGTYYIKATEWGMGPSQTGDFYISISAAP